MTGKKHVMHNQDSAATEGRDVECYRLRISLLGMLTILSDFRAKRGVANPQEEARMNACPPQEQPWCSTNVPTVKPGASQEHQKRSTGYFLHRPSVLEKGTFSLNPDQQCVPDGD
jgi:hypothetical protein